MSKAEAEEAMRRLLDYMRENKIATWSLRDGKVALTVQVHVLALDA